MQLARFDVIYESSNVVLEDHEWAVCEAGHRLANVFVRVGKRFNRPTWLDAAFVLDLAFEAIFGNCLQTAICVMDEDDLLGVQQSLRNNERPHDVIGHNATGISNDVGVTMGKPEHLKDVHAAVHAGNDCKVSPGGKGQSGVLKIGDEPGVVGDEFIRTWAEVGGGRHGSILAERVA